MTKVVFTAWTIDTNYTDIDGKEYSGFIGRYMWFNKKPPVLPVHLEGCHVAMFRTRALARQHLPIYGFPNARVVKVKVTVETIK